MTPQKTPLARTEWLAASALVIAILQGAYLVGVELQRVNDIDKRIMTVEAIQNERGLQMQQLAVDLARIDANLASLAEWAKEQREGSRK